MTTIRDQLAAVMFAVAVLGALVLLLHIAWTWITRKRDR